MNISGREMPTNKTTKAPSQRTTSQQVDGGATANDGEVAGANLVAAVAAETTAKVAAVMEEKMSMISNKLDIITAKLESESQRIEEAENRISSAEDTIADLEGRLADTENKLAALTNRMDDQEARSRRDNIRIFGIKEGIEGSNALHFFETWLPKFLHMETKKGRIRLDRCHRGLGRPKSGMPRVVIMKLHYPADKMKILALGAKQKLEYEGTKISIRQDIPQNILQQRRSFNDVCQKLISRNVRFRMQYPATLRFTYNNKDFSFDTAEEAAHVIGAMETVP